jgi:phage-related minor tail protein
MRASIDGPLQGAADRAGRAVEAALLRAARNGKLGFEDLEKLALQVLDNLAATALRSGMNALLGRSGGGGGVPGTSGGGCCCCRDPIGIGSGPGGVISMLAGLFGSPGRATGGPVSPGRPYMVGERGPELFVPTSAGSVTTPAAVGPREVRVAITVNARGDTAPRALAQSSRQVARAVKAALAGAD